MEASASGNQGKSIASAMTSSLDMDHTVTSHCWKSNTAVVHASMCMHESCSKHCVLLVATHTCAGQEDVDWSSVDQVANLVSKTTLAGLQQLWRQHATTMDETGRSFAEQMYTTHSQVVKVRQGTF